MDNQKIKTHSRSERSSRIAVASILISLGVFFLLQQRGMIANDLNWWTIFILIPGALMIYDALTQHERETNKLIGGVALVLIGGVLMFNVKIDFLPDIPWADLWPLLLVLAGISLLFTRGKNSQR